MRVLALIHQPDAASGVFGDAVRERGDELVEWNVSARGIPATTSEYDAAFVFGGGMHVDQDERHPWLRGERRLLHRLVADGVPLLGVCLGGQLVAQALGAPVARMPGPEVGWYEIELTNEAAADPVFGAIPRRFVGFQWHSYAFELPPGAVPLASNPVCLQAFRAGEAAWGIQFHAEVTAGSVDRWIASSRPDDDGAIDFERLRSETAERIAAWNELGRRLAGSFLDVARARR